MYEYVNSVNFESIIGIDWKLTLVQVDLSKS